MKITRFRKKGKVGVSFRRTGKVYYERKAKKKDMMNVLCFTWNSFDYLQFHRYMAQVLHTRLESNKKNLPIVIIGDAKFPPVAQNVERYYLTYNPANFIGEYEMHLYGENAFLIFHLHYPEDFGRYKHVAHNVVYLGSLCRIMFICYGDAVLPDNVIKKEKITDYDIFVIKDSSQYLPYNKHSESFEYLVPKKL